jgi:hypothetical protein
MNKELYMVVIPAVSWLLFALGGTQISDTVKGMKWIRRFVLPVVYAAACILAGYIWQGFLVGLIAMLVYHLGYGDKVPWWRKILVGAGYALVTVPMDITFWNYITFVAFIGLFILSNTKWSAKYFVWKICEGFFGLFVGIELAFLLIR